MSITVCRDVVGLQRSLWSALRAAPTRGGWAQHRSPCAATASPSFALIACCRSLTCCTRTRPPSWRSRPGADAIHPTVRSGQARGAGWAIWAALGVDQGAELRSQDVQRSHRNGGHATGPPQRVEEGPALHHSRGDDFRAPLRDRQGGALGHSAALLAQPNSRHAGRPSEEGLLHGSRSRCVLCASTGGTVLCPDGGSLQALAWSETRFWWLHGHTGPRKKGLRLHVTP